MKGKKDKPEGNRGVPKNNQTRRKDTKKIGGNSSRPSGEKEKKPVYFECKRETIKTP